MEWQDKIRYVKGKKYIEVRTDLASLLTSKKSSSLSRTIEVTDKVDASKKIKALLPIMGKDKVKVYYHECQHGSTGAFRPCHSELIYEQ